MTKAKDLTSRYIGTVVTVQTTPITLQGETIGAEGIMIGKLEAVYTPSGADYMVLTVSGEQYAVLHDTEVE